MSANALDLDFASACVAIDAQDVLAFESLLQASPALATHAALPPKASIQPPKHPRPLLWYACEKGALECVSLLLVAGADAQERDATGCPLVLHSLQHVQLDVIPLLLSAGAPLPTDSQGRTALMSLCAANAFMCYLRTHRDHILSTSSPGGTHYVEHAIEGHTQDLLRTLRLLLPLSDPIARDHKGFTALHYAVGSEFVFFSEILAPLSPTDEVSRLLREHGPLCMPQWAARLEREVLSNCLSTAGDSPIAPDKKRLSSRL